MSRNLFSALAATTMLTMAPAAYAAEPDAKPATDVTAKADSDMKRVLDALASLKPKPIETLSAAEARQQPTPADAVKKVLSEDGKSTAPEAGVATKDITIPSEAGGIKARVYTPEGAEGPLPVIVYYHGGGWVIADLDTYDATPRALAKQANAIVVSSHYRQAPEHKFPAAHEDAYTAYKWVTETAADWGGDAKRVALVGESAGGNLAINTAIKARDEGIQKPVYEVLVYPVAGVDMNTESYQEEANAKPLNKAMMGWFVKNTVNGDKDKQDPRLDVIGKANLKGLPPTTIITAELDPLRSDGEKLAEKLETAGVEVDYKNYEGVAHEFFGMGAVVSDAKDAQATAAKDLKTAFSE